MEYNPIAISEAMAYAFVRKDTVTGNKTQTPRFFVELVNTLTQAVPTAGINSNAATIDLGVNNYDLCITADDPVSRPDPLTGQLLPINNTAGTPPTVGGPIPLVGTSFNPPPAPAPGNVTMTALDPAAPPPMAPSVPPNVNVPTNYFNVIGNVLPAGAELAAPAVWPVFPVPAQGEVMETLAANFDPTDPTVAAPPGTAPPTPAPGALTLDPAAPAMINGVPVGVRNAYAPKPWMAPLPQESGNTAYYWICLRRPASPFLPPNPDITGLTGPYNPMIVVDSMRFPYIDGGGKVDNNGNVDLGNAKAIYSAQRAQPYRGGHAVRLPDDLTATAAVLNTAYGYSEQTVAPKVQVPNYGLYGNAPVTQNNAGVGFYHTLGNLNDQNEPWDWFVFHDRDFTSVAELMLVPGCPPGLFTKQFVELPPMVPSATPFGGAGYTNFPVAGTPAGSTFIFPPPNPLNPPPVQQGSIFPPVPPNAYSYPGPAGGALQPHTYPYLVDKFFYSGASLPLAALPAAVPPNANAANTDTAQQSVNTAASDGWFKMLEFFEVPSSMNGAIGPVAEGTNFDWARQDIKPGQLNLNLIVDEEVFYSVLGRQLYNQANIPVDPFTQAWLNFAQLMPNNPTEAFNIPQVATTGLATGLPGTSYSMWNPGISGGVTTADWLNFPPAAVPPPPVLNNNALKAAFAQFLAMRHGAIFDVNFHPLLFGFTGERPFRSLSYPDINYTVMRPATLPPANPAASPAPTPPVATPGTPYGTGTYAGDPGVRNPVLYPGGFASSVAPPAGYVPGTPFTALPAPNPNVILPPPVPALRLFQIPDAFGKTGIPPVIPPAAGTPVSNASDSGDPFINVAQTTGALGWQKDPMTGAPVQVPVTVPFGNFYLNNGYPNLVWSGNAPNNGTGVPAQPYLGGAGGGGGADFRQHPFWRLEMMQRVMNLTTPRTHQYAVWITIGFFEVIRQGDPGMMAAIDPRLAFDIMGPEIGAVTGKNVRFRGFFLVDRTKLTGFNPANTRSFRSAVVYRKVIQ
jgi:hypothetical protein